jgi:hypothetical protein
MNAAPTPTAATGAAPELGVVEPEAAAADAELEVDRAEEAAEDALERVPMLAEEAAPEAAEEAETGELLRDLVNQKSSVNLVGGRAARNTRAEKKKGGRTDVLVAAAAARVEVVMPAAESLIPSFRRQYRWTVGTSKTEVVEGSPRRSRLRRVGLTDRGGVALRRARQRSLDAPRQVEVLARAVREEAVSLRGCGRVQERKRVIGAEFSVTRAVA